MAAPYCALRYKAVLASFCLSLMGTGCKVYMPTLPYTPLVHERGQAEVGASVQLLGQVAGYAAYSPAKHLLVTASAAKSIGSSGGENHTKSTQGDAGLGYYYTFGNNNRWYVGALGSYGLAYTFSRFYVANSPIKEYRAHYSRYQGQISIARQGRAVAFGTAARLTNLNFASLTFNDVPVQEPVADLYGDYLFFIRVGKGAIQGQYQVGASTPLSSFFHSDSDLSSTATLVGLTLIIRPHLLGHREQPPQELK